MLDGFLGLRHHAIVGRDHQNHDIGRLGTTGTHGGERRVARGIEEGDHPALGFYVVGTDMLGNPPRLAHGDLGATDVVEQRGLAVVDVPHHGHDRRAGNGVAFEPQVFGQLLFQGVVADQLDLVAQLFGDQLGSFLIQHLVDGYRRTHLEHELDDFGRLDRHLLRQIGNRDGFADRHFAHDGAGGALEAMGVALFQLGLATTATAMTFILFARARGASERRLRLERRPMLSLLAITTLVVIVACLVGATRFFLLALLDRSGRHFGLYRCRRCGNRRNHRRPCTGLGFGLRLATGLFLGALTRFFLGLQTSRFLSGALLFQLALLLGLDLLGTALDEGLLLAHFHTDGLATRHFQLRGGLALQGDLARLIGLGAVAALQMRQQRLLFVIGHYLLGAGVRQSCLTHLLQQSLDRCVDHLGQFFHRDLRHAFLSSGR